jgi:hypothetical protein
MFPYRQNVEELGSTQADFANQYRMLMAIPGVFCRILEPVPEGFRSAVIPLHITPMFSTRRTHDVLCVTCEAGRKRGVESLNR